MDCRGRVGVEVGILQEVSQLKLLNLAINHSVDISRKRRRVIDTYCSEWRELGIRRVVGERVLEKLQAITVARKEDDA